MRFLSLLALTQVVSATADAPSVYVHDLQTLFTGRSVASQVETYQGIFFAQDTSGPSRFKPPRRYVYESGSTYDATRPGTPCSQSLDDMPPFVINRTHVGENCLTLSITRPRDTAPDAKLPVLAWMYGGALLLGAADDPIYDPVSFIQHSISSGHPVIYVAANYRLGIFGSAASDASSIEKVSNNALRDQKMALEWIRDHIAAFGGNPSRVTLYGQSAGGTTGALHTLSSSSNDLPFQQLMTMSGPPMNCVNMSRSSVALNTAAVASRFDCAPDGITDFDCLRKVDHDALLHESISYARQLHPPLGGLVYLPVVDDDIFKAAPSKSLAHGHVAKVRLLAGWTHDEATALIGDRRIENEEDIASAIRTFYFDLDDKRMQHILGLYNLDEYQLKASHINAILNASTHAQWHRAMAIMSDITFRCPTISYAKAVNQVSPGEAYIYALNQSVFTPMFASMGMPQMGVVHGSDISYTRGSVPEKIDDFESHNALAKRFMDIVLAFAYNGSPARASAFRDWPQAVSISGEGIKVQAIGGPLGDGIVSIDKDLQVLEDAEAPDIGQMSTDSVLGKLWEAPQMIMGAMRKASSKKNAYARQREFDSMRLFERCEYINSLHETGVFGS